MGKYNKFEVFAGDLGRGVHDLRSSGHKCKVFLTNTAPDAELDCVKSSLQEIEAGNGYPEGGIEIRNNWKETGGVGQLFGKDILFTAIGGSFGPFRYAVLYNSTSKIPNDPLIGWWDCEEEIIVGKNQAYAVDCGGVILTIN